MSGAVATQSAATQRHERGWGWFVVAVLTVLAVTAAPIWPPALALFAAIVRLALPIEQFVLMALVALTACAVVGWWAGGRLVVALLWLAACAWIVYTLPLPQSGYGSFVRGWSLVLGASFGLVCLATGSRPFLGRALAGVGLAMLVTAIGASSRVSSDTNVVISAERALSNDYERRIDESLHRWKSRTESGVWQAFATRVPQVASRADTVAQHLDNLGSTARGDGLTVLVLLSPALLGLESLLALALGWAAYHRLARIRVGPPLAALRNLRFNDQLIWGLVVGTIVGLLPTLQDWRVVGLNLLLFFGTLYALRGIGVLSWWVPDRVALVLLLALVVLVPLLGPFPVLATVVVLAFVIGLSDTWRDFRAAARARRPDSFS